MVTSVRPIMSSGTSTSTASPLRSDRNGPLGTTTSSSMSTHGTSTVCPSRHSCPVSPRSSRPQASTVSSSSSTSPSQSSSRVLQASTGAGPQKPQAFTWSMEQQSASSLSPSQSSSTPLSQSSAEGWLLATQRVIPFSQTEVPTLHTPWPPVSHRSATNSSSTSPSQSLSSPSQRSVCWGAHSPQELKPIRQQSTRPLSTSPSQSLSSPSQSSGAASGGVALQMAAFCSAPQITLPRASQPASLRKTQPAPIRRLLSSGPGIVKPSSTWPSQSLSSLSQISSTGMSTTAVQ